MTKYRVDLHFDYEHEADGPRILRDLVRMVQSWPGSSNLDFNVVADLTGEIEADDG